MPPQTFASLAPELTDFVADGLAAKAAERNPGVVGYAAFPGSTELITGLVRSALDYAAQTYGDAASAAILAYKAQIRTIVGPALIEAADKILHGLQDAKASS